MSKLAHSCDETMEQIEINSFFAYESRLWQSEAFEICFNNNVPVEKIPDAYQNLYLQWQYFNIK